jgi:hypothetical protein
MERPKVENYKRDSSNPVVITNDIKSFCNDQSIYIDYLEKNHSYIKELKIKYKTQLKTINELVGNSEDGDTAKILAVRRFIISFIDDLDKLIKENSK